MKAMKQIRLILAWLLTGFTALILVALTAKLWQREKSLASGRAVAAPRFTGTLLVAEAPFGEKAGEIYLFHLDTGKKETLAGGMKASEVIADEGLTRLAYVRYQEEQFVLYVLDMDSGKERELYRVDSSAVNALRLSSWSPDGEYFFVMAATSTGSRPSGTLYLASVADGKLYKLGQGTLIAWPKWAPDGSAAFYSLKSRGYPAVYMLEPNDPKPVEVDMVSESFAISPDSAEVAYATYSYTRGANELRVWDIKAQKSRSVASGALSGNNKSVLFWLPDGSAIFYLAGPSFMERDLYVVEEGKAPRNLTEDFAGMVVEAALSPEGTRIATSIMRSFQTFAGDLVLVDLENEESKRLLESERTPAWLSWGPEGRLLAFSEIKAERKGMGFEIVSAALSVLDLETGDLYPVAEGQTALTLGWLD